MQRGKQQGNLYSYILSDIQEIYHLFKWLRNTGQAKADEIDEKVIPFRPSVWYYWGSSSRYLERIPLVVVSPTKGDSELLQTTQIYSICAQSANTHISNTKQNWENVYVGVDVCVCLCTYLR